MNDDSVWLWLADGCHLSLDFINLGDEGRDTHLIGHANIFPLLKYQHGVGYSVRLIHRNQSFPSNSKVGDIFNIHTQFKLD